MKSSWRSVGNDSDRVMRAIMHSEPPARLVRTRTRRGSSRQAAIRSAAVPVAASAIHPRSEGKAVSRNADVSWSMIIRSTKSTVIQSLSNLNRESSVSATTNSIDIRAATTGRRNRPRPEEIEHGPDQQECGLGDQIGLGRGHDDQCDQVKDCGEAKRYPLAAGNCLGGHKTAEQNGRAGRHA